MINNRSRVNNKKSILIRAEQRPGKPDSIILPNLTKRSWQGWLNDYSSWIRVKLMSFLRISSQSRVYPTLTDPLNLRERVKKIAN